MRNLLFVFSVVIIAAACSLNMAMQQDFAKSSEDYNRSLRWGEFEKASLYVPESGFDAFMKKVSRSKDVKVVDLRTLRINFDKKKGEAKVRVEIDYYRLPSMKVKTLIDTQKWMYVEEKGEKIWRLETLLPDFK